MIQSANHERTRELLLKHFQAYPKLKSEDIFKYLFQSTFGCEHLLSDEEAALNYIKQEYESLLHTEPSLIEPLDGVYSRVHLSCLNRGLTPETLTRLFILSTQEKNGSIALLEHKLHTAKMLVAEGALPIDRDSFGRSVDEWRKAGYPAIHHSNDFRLAYHPAYRVIANVYASFLPVFAEIDKRLGNGSLTVAIEGGSASGKTTLANILRQVYDCNVFHMDDFFLRPEQRTPDRFAEIGGNVDRERFYDEVLTPLINNEVIRYRPFDCSVQALKEPIPVFPKKLTVVEGVYSMHPSFGKYYDLSVFLDISADYQKERIIKRNSPVLVNRFLGEWIPLENAYFTQTHIKSKCDILIQIA